MTHTGSISRLPVTLEIANKGFAECEMIRHLSPVSVGMILKRLPLQDRIHKLADKLVYIETGLTIGAEKQKTRFKRGDIAYMTSNGSICIFIKDSSVTPMNPIGVVKSNLEIIEDTRAGDIMILSNTQI
ncbi:MAG TPA: cyclophilin-like fold protein [Nitrososphaeraceae archaeon]|nr:cyclophilin-like fold protein [Nitrososphaeraceae archaeon]